MSAITLVNIALHALLISVIGWSFVRWCVPDARHRAWASLLVLLAAVIAPWLMEIRPDRSFKSSSEVSPATTVAPWKPDWKFSTVSVAPLRIHAATVGPVSAEPAWSVAALSRWVCGVAILGIIMMALRHCAMSMRARRWRRSLRSPTREELDALPAAASNARLGVSHDCVCPCVVGLWRPVIAVPQRIIHEWNFRQWMWLLRHEGEHVRARDTLIAWLLVWTKALLWWNPFVYALVEQWSQAREEICDAAAVRGETDSTAYSRFLLDIAASVRAPSPLLLHMAASRPARRLRARVTAILAKRSVREKVSRLFLLAAFAIMAFIAALVSCVGLKAEELPAAKSAELQSPTLKVEPTSSAELYTRTFRVWTDFVKRPVGAVNMLKGHDIPFPEGASASFVPSTRQLIVRNTTANLDRIETLLRGLQAQRAAAPVKVRLVAKWITVDPSIPDASSWRILSMLDGKTEFAILTDAEYQATIRTFTQRKGVDLVSAPSVTTRFGQQATVEVIREFSGKETAGTAKDPAKASPDFIGSRNVYLAQFEGEKLRLEAQADLGELDEKDRTLPQVRHLRKSASVIIGNGETLFLRMGQSQADPKRLVMLFVTAELIDSKGQLISVEQAQRLLDEALPSISRPEQAMKLNVPDRDKVPLTANQLQKLEGLLSKAYSYYNLGDFENSTKAFQDAVRIDPSNGAARRGMERAEQKRSEAFDSARDRKRAKLLSEIGIPGSKDSTGAYYAAKMEKIIFPQVQCKGASVEEMVEYLRIKSRDYDKVEKDPTKRGVNLLMKHGMAPTTALITLDLKNVSMSEALKKITELGRVTFSIEDYAVVVIPLTEPDTDPKSPVDAKSVNVSVWIVDVPHGKDEDVYQKFSDAVSRSLPKGSGPPIRDPAPQSGEPKRVSVPAGIYHVDGVFTKAQQDILHQTMAKRKDIKTTALPAIVASHRKPAIFQDGGRLTVEVVPTCDVDSKFLRLDITVEQRASVVQAQGKITTSVSTWDGYTIVLRGLLKDGADSRLIFITAKTWE